MAAFIDRAFPGAASDAHQAERADMLDLLESIAPPATVESQVKGKARRGSENRQMAGRIPVRFTDSELADAEAEAKAAGLSLEAWLRDAACTEPDERGSDAHVTRRAHIKYLRVNDAQRERITALADRAGISTGSYIRARGCRRPVTLTTRRPPVEKAELARLLGLLGRVSGNLHQLVRGQNFGHEVREVDATEAIAEVQGAAAEIMRSLGRQVVGRMPRGRQAG